MTQVLQEHSHGAGATVPDESRAQRFSSHDVSDFPAPTGREEEWRFTPVDRLRGLTERPPGPGGSLDVAVDAAAEVVVTRVPREDAAFGTSGGVPDDRVAALAWSSVTEATVVRVPAEAVSSRPTTLTFTGAGVDTPAFGHVVVELERFAEATVVLDYRGSATVADNVEVRTGDGALLTVVSIHDWADESVHVAQHHLRVGRDSRVKHVAVTLGGDVVRVSASATFDGPGGSVDLLGLYFADAGQHLEHRLFVDHAVPRCRSNVLYKGALQGDDAHTVWVGDVLIRAAAEGTDTYELNRNLVLTDGARADSVPNLEIETGEIEGAGHASATGRFDDEQLFYLQARGIPEQEARRLVVRGFFADLISQIGVHEVAERLLEAVEAELGGGRA